MNFNNQHPVDLSLLSPEEWKQLEAWNSTQIEYEQHKCIHQLVEDQAERTPDQIAILFEDQVITYRELNQRANQLAHYLRTLGAGPEVLVGICMERSPEMIIALLGILKAGSAYVPLDSKYPIDRLTSITEDAQFPFLVTQNHLLNLIPQNSAKIVCIDRDRELLAQQSCDALVNNAMPGNLAYVLYTSGSTGRPKGVAIEHSNTVAFISWAKACFSSDQLKGVLASTSLCFDLSVFEIFVTLSSGGKIILAQDALQLPTLTTASEVTLINTVPSAIATLLKVNGIPSSVNTINLAGEPLQSALTQKLYQLNNIQCIYNLYGPTEDTTYSTVALIPQGATEIPSIGKPISNTQIYLLEEPARRRSDRLKPVPIGTPGEIYIGGAGLARGYLNRPDLTEEKFFPNPFSQDPAARLYRTGDLAVFLPDGSLRYLGRLDYQVKIRGFRIELGEIESVLMQHPFIEQAVVVAYEALEGDKRLVSYIVPKTETIVLAHALEPQVLQNFLSQRLPDYMVPSAFVFLDDMPLTLNGKVDRRALPIPAWAPHVKEHYIAPQTDREVQITEIWEQLLGVRQVGIQDNFFELGGHSLLVAQLIYQINEIYQVDFPIFRFLECPTVAGIAQLIEEFQEQICSDNSTDILSSDLDLDSSICPENKIAEPIPNLFVTGVTGFLGTHLLHELLQKTKSDIYCLVRATDASEAKQKIQSSLQQYQLWNDSLSERIIPVVGDLGSPYLRLEAQQFERLAEKIDVIYHCGAWVNIIYPYSVLRKVNVIGTQEVLRLAGQTKTKPVHFISTIDVFPSTVDGSITVVREEDEIGPAHKLYSGYAQSKYVAEQLIATAHSRGIPVMIYRPSNIMGDSHTGISPHSAFVPKMIKGCIQMGKAPAIETVLNLVPVDYVCRAIVHLSTHNQGYGRVFHLVNPQGVSWNQMISWINNFGYSIQQTSYEIWYGQLLKLSAQRTDNVLIPLHSLFKNQPFIQKSLGAFDFDSRVTDELSEHRIICSVPNEKLFHTYLSYFVKSQLLSPPTASETLDQFIHASRQ